MRIDPTFLQRTFAPGHSNSVREIAASLGIDKRTLQKEIDKLGIEREFSTMTDEELDQLLELILEEHPDGGFSYILGELRSFGIRVQQHRVKSSLRRVDPGRHFNRPPPRSHRVYHVTRPNKVWHGDGYHKLIRWGFVIHGFVDGYSRMVSTPIYADEMLICVGCWHARSNEQPS